jgi:phage terminase small subunit
MANLTPKQEAFCLAYIETGNASAAYRLSYNAGGMKPESVNRKAKELLDNGKIAARLVSIHAEHRGRHRITVDDLVSELEEARVAAMTAETAQASAATAATMGKAKLLGFLTDKVDATVTYKPLRASVDDFV